MAHFTDGKQRIATMADVQAPWNGEPDGKRFRCYLCGKRFAVGDAWRWVYAHAVGTLNFLVCCDCDGPDVLERWVAHVQEGKRRFWWMMRP